MAEQSATYWGLHHWGHPPHISCDARVLPGAGSWAWELQHSLLQPPLSPSKYHPGKQNHYKMQPPTSCSRCSYMSVPCSRRTLGVICTSQLQHFPGSHPALISAKLRKPSVVGDHSSEPFRTYEDEVNRCPGVLTSLLWLQREPSSHADLYPRPNESLVTHFYSVRWNAAAAQG